jgi:acetylornithine deacetylase/succinyl-diaminopimelate desuccinylase-like protein
MADYKVEQVVKDTFTKILEVNEVKEALDFIEKDLEQTIIEQKELVQIEAPTFNEQNRAKHYAKMLEDLGMDDVHIDEHGNVLSYHKGVGDGPTVLLEAHLDTVFPFGTDVKPVEKDGRIYAPGICDDTRGLVANLSVIRALKKYKVETLGDIIIAGTVAEEGLGGMWGMRKLLEDHPEIKASLSIDGAGVDSVTYEATGIRNFSVTYTGPGGHAYGAFGLPSPLHAAARTIAKLSDMRPPEKPKTTFTVSEVTGGHQIHAIAEKANFKINMRSDDPLWLDKIEKEAIEIFELGAKEENQRWSSNEIKVEYEKILDVPAGTQDKNSFIVQTAWEATKAVGVTPRLAAGGCTNTNQAVHLGVPAVTLGRGGKEGGIHSLGEWFDPEGVHRASQKSFLMLLALAGVKNKTEPIIK